MSMAQECFEQTKRPNLEKELEDIERRVQNLSNEDPPNKRSFSGLWISCSS